MTPHSTRRDFLALSATAALATAVSAQAQPAPAAPTGPFTLAPLPYAKDALLPHIDALTMDIHHSKHHQAYVNGLNTALKSETALQKKSLEELIGGILFLPEGIYSSIRSESVDVAIMEKLHDIAVVPAPVSVAEVIQAMEGV